jgi:lipopolysaccharide transport system ATP-binding protein
VDPDILVVDEALSVGDAAFQFRCVERMLQLRDSGVTLLLVSHEMSVIKSFCNQVLYLAKGKEKMCGPADIVGEQYFLDIWGDQQRQLSSAPPISWKPPLAESVRGMAFGTQEGSIVSAFFKTGVTTLSVASNSRVQILVVMEYASNLVAPSLSLFLQDYRMIEIGGKSFPLHPEKVVDGRANSTLSVEFDAKLKAGVYFITLRLENRETDRDISPLDKQVGALSLVVSSSQSDLLGLVDIGMQLAGQDHV